MTSGLYVSVASAPISMTHLSSMNRCMMATASTVCKHHSPSDRISHTMLWHLGEVTECRTAMSVVRRMVETVHGLFGPRISLTRNHRDPRTENIDYSGKLYISLARLIRAEAYTESEQLEEWLDRCLEQDIRCKVWCGSWLNGQRGSSAKGYDLRKP
jgi:hypothetical protein